MDLDTTVTIGNLTLDRNQNLTIDGPNALTLYVSSGIPTLDVNSGRTVDFRTELAGTDGLLLQGGGRVDINAAPTLDGGLTVIGSTVRFNPSGGFNSAISNSALGTGALSLSEGGEVALRGTMNNATGDVSIGTGGGTIENRGNNNYVTSGILTGSGMLTYGNAGGAGGRSLRFDSTENDFTGGFVLTHPQQTIRVNSLGGGNNITFSDSGEFRYHSGAETDVTLGAIELNGSSGTIHNASSDHAITINSDLIASGSGGKTLTLSGAAGPTNSFAGVIADETDEGTGTVALTKSGASIWVLGGDNTYTGATTISAGTLVINGDQSAATGAVAVNGSSTLGGSGTVGGDVTVAAGANLAPGASIGTLSIGGDLDISAMADGSGTLFYELGGIAASDRIDVGGSLEIGEGLLGFGDFDFSDVGGLEDGVYTLISSNGLSGTLDGADLSGTIGTFEATLQTSGNNIELALTAPPPTTTLVIDLGAGTGIPGGEFGTFGAANLPIPPLPEGSILRSVEVDAVLEDTDNENFAGDLAVLFDPTPETSGDDFSVVITNGPIKFDADVELGWTDDANDGPPTPLVDTKVAADWAAAGSIDLATTGIFLGNAFDNDGGASEEGGTWSGTITLTYDAEPTGTPFELWAGTGVDFDGDASGNGVPNGLAFLLGAASPGDNAIDLLPVANEDAGGLVLSFSMLNAANRGASALSVEFSNDLGDADPWAAAEVPETSSTVNDVVFTITPNGTLNDVVAAIPASKADGTGKLFARLKATE